MNVLFFLKPKPVIVYLEYNYTMRQACEVMKKSKYTNLPVIGENGEFLYTLSESDILFLMIFHLDKAKESKLVI